ncbi:efflux RND transporter permease subunit [Noviherbaspirillum sedimenti]|uniref:RND transporter n=1 Tax=Noviherbaspirillum sedimenti TaxID=2320865 RepID=A0A3A3G7F1_9BURK|nr:MMPL family transporter [Noviherbaspirillum sedimenti]RJG02482.1 RND transporter [Noviherbaspirillum sedimenti]
MKTSKSSRLEKFVEACIRHRIAVTVIFTLLTLVMGFFAARVEVKTVFDDLLPTSHDYIEVHKRFRQDFGGSNMVSIMVEVEQGDIFNIGALEKVKKLTNDLALVHGVNPFQILSLASSKLKDIKSSTDAIESSPVMFPDVPKTAQEMDALRNTVLKSPLIYGAYVSQDLKAALITVDFYENEVDYSKIFPQIMKLVDSAQGDGVRVRVVGEPILFGWVDFYVPETMQIFMMTLACLLALLFVTARTWRGTLLPLLAGATSAIWALGAARLIGYNLDPLVIVIAFLITARSISHSVQLVTRFGDELATGASTPRAAASSAMLQLFKPGMLGVVADAGCMVVVVLTPIPLMQKISLIGTIWVLTIGLCACVMTPVLLSWVKQPKGFAHPINIAPALERLLDLCIAVATSRRRYFVLAGTAVVLLGSGAYAFKLQVGDADAGSPILWRDSRYNQDAAAINKQFQGADRMYVVFEGKQPGAIKEPAVLNSMASMQRFMGAQPEIGGSLSLVDILPMVNQVLREGNPRYRDLGRSANENGELLYMWGPDAGDAARFMEPQQTSAPVTFFFKDHRGETIRTAIHRVKEFIAENPIEQGKYVLAGGLIGVTAAVNEVIFAGQIESIALALLVLVICCAVAYRSTRAGIFFMVPVVLSNTITFSVMAWQGIGMTLSTLPVAALGIGLGVDYAFYVVDAIREELHENDNLELAIAKALRTAGMGVLITSLTLTVSVVLWFSSSLRFQAEMGILMAIWLFVSSFSALFIVPSMVYVFKPEFVMSKRKKTVADCGAMPARRMVMAA